jgi:hypothetical protein
MTTEELLKPRIKVMVDFPQWSAFKHKKDDILELKGIHFVGAGTAKSINENEVDLYPAIFRKLNWWEERKVEDMPEYVKDKWGKFYKVLIHFRGLDKEQAKCYNSRFDTMVFYENCIPSTLEEYNQYNNLK